MKQLLFAVVCLLVFGTIIAMGQYYKQQEIDSTFAEAESRVDSFPDLPTINSESLIPQELIEKELAKIKETEVRVSEEATAAAEQAAAASEERAPAPKKDLDVPTLAGSTANAVDQAATASTNLLESTSESVTTTTSAVNDAAESVSETVTTTTSALEGAGTEGLSPADPPVLKAEPIQMDEDGLPLKVVEATTVAMADTTQAATDAVSAVGEAATGVASGLRSVAAEALGPRVVIIGYHQFAAGSEWGKSSHITPASVLKGHLNSIKDNGYVIVPLAQVVAALKGGGEPLPPRAAVITVDNGFNNALKIAKPILDENESPWSFFVFTQLISTGATGATWDQLLVDIQDSHFDVQSQTKSHVFLTRRKGRDDKHYGEFLEKELQGSRSTIEQRLNQPVTALAFPFGNYNDEIIAKAKEYGYETMLTTVPMFVDFSKGPAALTTLPRFIVTKESAPYLDSFLSDHALEATAITPRPGSVDEAARPTITLKLAPTTRFNPGTLTGVISGVDQVEATYDEAAHAITLTPQSDLNTRAVRVQVKAQTPDGKDMGLSWYYYYGPKLLPTE